MAGCAERAGFGDGSIPLRNPTVPIGAITRFDPALFDGPWQVIETAGGAWDLRAFAVEGKSTGWRGEVAGAPPRTGFMTQRATGILQITYEDGAQRDLWIVWIDPDHQTAALGDPDGRFGFVATRPGRARADQVAAARQVLDFNGYRTETWEGVP